MRKITFRLLMRLPTKLITNGLLSIILLFAYGIIGSHFIMGLNIIDSIYYSVITMATVGYGDYTPVTGIQKIFATTLALGGVALLAYVFNTILTNFKERMGKYSRGARKMKKIKQMDDYYILCGYGRVGKVVYDELSHRQQNVIIFEKNEELCENIRENSSTVVLNKDATEDNLIAKLAAEKCKSVIISTGDDVTNLFIVLTIREINPNAWIVSRVSKSENFSRLKNAGADKLVSPELIGGKDLYLESAKPHLLRLTVKHSPDEILDEFKIISKHGCTLENIDYHIPGIETPLSRDIHTMNIEDGKHYKKYLDHNKEAKAALNNLYASVNNIHSHWISGPNRSILKDLVKDLEKQETILGKNMTDKEIMEITKKNK
ncbi:MAG: NAD-binding protein [Methanobrevibacter sp.]|nr:NAD-binding protein [Methanobrevibacter sp.]